MRKSFMKRFSGKRKGFTLVEMLVVIGIIGVLSAIAAPTALSKVKEAKEKTDVANAGSIAAAIKSEIADGNEDYLDDNVSDADKTALANEYFDGNLPESKVDGEVFNIEVTGNKVKVATSKATYYPWKETAKVEEPAGEGGGE